MYIQFSIVEKVYNRTPLMNTLKRSMPCHTESYRVKIKFRNSIVLISFLKYTSNEYILYKSPINTRI